MSLQDFDDGADLSTYDFTNDNFSVPIDAANKRKLAYRHRYIGDLYSKVCVNHELLLILHDKGCSA